MADETKVTIKAKVAQKIIGDKEAYTPLKGELVAINKDGNVSLKIGQEKEGFTELQELNYVEGKVDSFYITAGQNTETQLGEKATAEGNSVTASGKYSHAEGDSTTASDNGSHAEGSYTIASGTYSHAEGFHTEASGDISHAEGISTRASGNFSHAEGQGSKATRRSQHVFGEYNTSESPDASTKGVYVEIVGNGTGDNARSNARTLDWSGNEWLAGKLTVGRNPENRMDVATKGYVDSTQQVVTSDKPGLAPQIVSASQKDLVLGCVYNGGNGRYTAQWLELGAEGITVNSVTADTDGIVPKYGSEQKKRALIVTANNKVEWAEVPGLEELVTADTDGIVPKYGNEQKKRVLIVTDNNKVEWVEAEQLDTLTAESPEIEGVYLESKNGTLTWSIPVIVDGTSYSDLKDAINNPIDFIEDEQSS